MQNNLDYGEVTSKAYTYLQNNFSYSDVTLHRYRSRWLLVKNYMEDHGLEFLSATVCKSFLLYLYCGRGHLELTDKEKLIEKSVSVLTEFIETGSVKRKCKFRYLDGSIGVHMKDYISFKRSTRLKTDTLDKIENHMSHFNFWLTANGIVRIDDIKHPQIITFIKSLDPSKKAFVHDTLKDLRGFFTYLYSTGLITTNMSAFIPKDNYKQQAKLPSYYTEEEIEKLFRTVDRGTNKGKRDYAILTLATYLGLRASDIALLRFNNLQWEKNTISVKQYKTGKDIILPLLPVVGNALIDYIQYGRAISNEPYIFLLISSPFPPMNPQTVVTMIHRRFIKAGFRSTGRKHGGHALRHSLVKELLNNKQSLPVISEVLGHKSTSSTRHYIRIDIENLRQCALEVPPVDPAFYTQQGGVLFS
jgi:site-specific recombinase XerD